MFKFSDIANEESIAGKYTLSFQGRQNNGWPATLLVPKTIRTTQVVPATANNGLQDINLDLGSVLLIWDPLFGRRWSLKAP